MNDFSPLYPLLSIERLRMETDGAGVTSLVAGAGCPLRCKYCINRNLLQKKPPEWITPEALLDNTKIDDLYYQATGGGLCFGGGESLLHTDFIEVFRRLIAGKWKLTAETSLNVPLQNVKKAAGCIDAFIVDIKSLDAEIYRSYTGRNNADVIRNLRFLAYAVPPEKVTIRIPLIPSYNSEADRTRSKGILEDMGFKNFDLFSYVVK